MEQNSDIENEYNGDTFFDGSMLDKLRSCSIIPRSLTDFQVFVRGLTGDAISDTVVQEAWKKIYSETGHALEIESESSEPKLSISRIVVGDNNAASTLQSLDTDSNTDSKKVAKRKRLTHSGVKIFKNVKKSCSENEPTKCYEQFASTPCEKQLPPNQNPCNYHNGDTPSRSAVRSSRKEGKRLLPYFPAIRISQQENEMDDDVISDAEQEKNGNSSDCEVIEIVSLHKTNNGVSGDISFTGPESDSECDESHSDTSVEILEPLYNTEQVTEHSVGNVHNCPIHGGKGHFNSPSSPVSNIDSGETSNCIDEQMNKLHVQTDYNRQKTGIDRKSFNKEKQEKVKKGKRGKYKILRTEVQCLKSLLVNLLKSLQSPSIDNRGEKIEVISQVDLRRLLENQREGKKKGSFHRKKPKVERIESEPASTKKPSTKKSSAFVEVNMSTKKTMLHEKKQSVKYTKPCDKTYESFPKKMDFDLNTNFDNGKREKFLWREIITDCLKLKLSNQMPVEELKRSVIAKYYYYRGNVSQNTSVKFFRYLHSTAGVVVDGDMVSFSNKKVTKVSSKSEQKKQFVMKTVTTRKEYKVS